MLSARMPTDITTAALLGAIGMVRTRYSTPLTNTFSVPGANRGNWKPRWNTTWPDDGDRPVVSTPRLGSLSCSGYMLASTMESSRRSNCAASLSASTTDVSTVNTATTAAAAAADASATRVRSEADRPNRGMRTLRIVAQDVADPTHGVDHPR